MAQSPPAIGRCLLFVYGRLQPGLQPPETMREAWPDRVRGLLYDLGSYPAAVEIGRASACLQGYVVNVSETELAQLDQFEAVSEGLYRRIRTTTAGGADVWVYEYARPLPADARGPLPAWPAAQRTDTD